MIGDRWGVTEAESTRTYPCDDVVPHPGMQVWRGVTVQVPPRSLALGGPNTPRPYSYDWIDNLGRSSPRRLHNLPDPVPGESFTTALGGRRLGQIIAVSPGVDLTAEIMGAVLSYVLVPQGATTRLLLKVVMARGGIVAPLVSVGDLVMARRQLLNLARLAERMSPSSVG